MNNSPRYITDENGTPVRRHRVFDTHTRQVIIYTADPLIAARMAQDYEKQWLRSTWSTRNYKRLGRALRRLWKLVRRPASEPTPPPTVREQRVAFVEELCDKGRRELAASRSTT